MNNYNKVVEFNKVFGVKMYPTEIDTCGFINDSKLANYRISLITEEYKELLEAFQNNNIIEVVDALLDILYVVYGMGSSFGYDMDKYFRNQYKHYDNSKSLFEFVKCSKNNMKQTSFDYFNDENVKECLNKITKCYDKFINTAQNNILVQAIIYYLVKLIYLCYEMGYICNIDMDKGFDLVHESNMSKVCKNEDVAIRTVEYYKDEFNKGTQPYDTPAYRKSDDNKYYVVYNKSTSKILKSIEYYPVNLVCLF